MLFWGYYCKWPSSVSTRSHINPLLADLLSACVHIVCVFAMLSNFTIVPNEVFLKSQHDYIEDVIISVEKN